MSKTVSLYMIQSPVIVNKDTSLNNVVHTMEKAHISHVLVNDDNADLVGVISKEDILKKTRYLLGQTTGKTYSLLMTNSIKAADIMTEKPIVVSPSDSVEYAVELLLQKEFHCLPVVENHKAVGIVTFYDLLKGYYDEFG